MKRTILFLSLALVAILSLAALHSCITTNSYNPKIFNEEQRKLIVRPSRPLEQLTQRDSIYLVNHNQVREFISDKDLALVCHYLTWCKSEYCISPDLIHSLLQQTGLPYLMIAGDFYSASGYNANYPFITIDSDYYNTHRYNRSIKRLFQALGCGDNWWHNYTIFRRGEYAGSGRSLEEAMKFVEK